MYERYHFIWPTLYVCVCNSSQTTEPICIKIIPANKAFDADCYGLLRFEIFTPTIFITPPSPSKVVWISIFKLNQHNIETHMSRPRFQRFLRNLAHWCTFHNLPWYWYCFRGRVRLGGKGRFWCAACKPVNRTCSTSTLFFPYFFVSGPCARLRWPSCQLLSARLSTVSYRIHTWALCFLPRCCNFKLHQYKRNNEQTNTKSAWQSSVSPFA